MAEDQFVERADEILEPDRRSSGKIELQRKARIQEEIVEQKRIRETHQREAQRLQMLDEVKRIMKFTGSHQEFEKITRITERHWQMYREELGRCYESSKTPRQQQNGEFSEIVRSTVQKAIALYKKPSPIQMAATISLLDLGTEKSLPLLKEVLECHQIYLRDTLPKAANGLLPHAVAPTGLKKIF